MPIYDSYVVVVVSPANVPRFPFDLGRSTGLSGLRGRENEVGRIEEVANSGRTVRDQ
jgi:hypothetical protein